MALDRAGFSREHQERRLKCIFCVLLVVQHSQTEPKHHRPMSSDQRVKGRLVVLVGEAPQQLSVRKLGKCLSYP
jgi:hypothetical protein